MPSLEPEKYWQSEIKASNFSSVEKFTWADWMHHKGKKKSFFHIFSHHFGAHGPRAFGIGICSDTANAPSGHLDGHGCRGIHRKDADRFGRVILGISRTHDASKQLIAHGICLHLKVKE